MANSFFLVSIVTLWRTNHALAQGFSKIHIVQILLLAFGVISIVSESLLAILGLAGLALGLSILAGSLTYFLVSLLLWMTRIGDYALHMGLILVGAIKLLFSTVFIFAELNRMLEYTFFADISLLLSICIIVLTIAVLYRRRVRLTE
jgi:hypothetical protein